MKSTVSAVLLTCLAVAGCTTAPPPSSAPPPSAPATSAPATSAAAPATAVRVAALKGPTGMGLAKLMSDQAATVQATIHGTPDEVTPALIKGDLDVALLPANLAAVLNARTNGAVQVAAVANLGVLYVIEAGDTVRTLADLSGKTVATTGKGTTPQYVADFLLAKAGLTGKVDLQYRSEASEVATALVGGQTSLAILPEPYVSTVLAKKPGLRVALDLTAEWTKAAPDSQFVTGVVVVRKQFAQDHPDAFAAFLDGYKSSVAFTNDHPDEAAPLIAAQGIVPDAATARTAIPRCHLVALTGAAAKTAIAGYLQVLYAANPESTGGKLPDDAFYFGA